MSGIRMYSAAPTRVAWGATRRASPPGGWPLGRWPTPGAGWVMVFSFSGSSIASAGRLFSASAYRPPAPTWLTGRNGVAASTVRVEPAAWAGLATIRVAPMVRTVSTADLRITCLLGC
jgi:hypothetical protein